MRRYLFLLLLMILNCTAIHKANKFYDQGDYELVIQNCLKTLETDSLNSEAHYLLGKSYYQQKKLELAIQSLTMAWQIQPATRMTPLAKTSLVVARLDFVDSLFNRGDSRSAREELFTILELDTANIPARLKLGNYYHENGLLDKAATQYRTILGIDSSHQIATSQLEKISERTQLAEINFEKGQANYQAYRYQTAVKNLKKALQHKPDHKDAQYYLALANGCILYRKGSKSNCWDAISEFGKSMMLRPDSGEPHYFMALAYEKKDRNEFENAIEEYKIAVEKDPDAWFSKNARKKIKSLIHERDVLKKFWGK